MSRTWVVVADSTRARIFMADSPAAALVELRDMHNSEGRLHDRELTSDLPGRSFDSKGKGRHAMEPPTDPKRELVIEFARELASYLESARNQHDFDQLAIVAAPAFLGHLREHFHAPLASRVSYELDKNLTQLDAGEIRRHLPQSLPTL